MLANRLAPNLSMEDSQELVLEYSLSLVTPTSTSTLFKFGNIAKDTLGLACS